VAVRQLIEGERSAQHLNAGAFDGGRFLLALGEFFGFFEVEVDAAEKFLVGIGDGNKVVVVFATLVVFQVEALGSSHRASKEESDKVYGGTARRARGLKQTVIVTNYGDDSI
jgi:hypothetical protein